MSNDLINDLEKVLAEHKERGNPEVIRWIPICEQYKVAGSAFVEKEKGGSEVIMKHGRTVKVLAWLQVSIDPSKHSIVRILQQVTV